MGEVYRARDPRLGRDVAVKILPGGVAGDVDRLHRFEQEARAAAALSHPNILAVYDVGTHGGAPYIVSEVLEGATLRDLLNDGPIAPKKCAEYAVQVCQGLAAAHEKGIVHRDLKPENLFVTSDGRVKILDFGIAKLSEPAPVAADGGTLPTRAAGTRPGVVMGTVGYMSPEQVRGEAADPRSDIFSFGAVLYELFASRRAFEGSTAVETMTAILREDPPEMPLEQRGLSPALDRIVRRCLEKSPAERFQSAKDVSFALDALSHVRSSRALPALAGTTGRRRRLVDLSAAIAGTALVLGAAFGAYLRAHPPDVAQYRQVTFRRGEIVSAAFSPDGQSIVYTARWDASGPQVYLSRVDSLGERPLGISGEVREVSANGDLLLLTNRRVLASFMAVWTLARVPIAGGSPRELLTDVGDADWSPDGSQIAVIRFDESRRKWRVEYPAGQSLYESDDWLSDLRVSPRGDRLAVVVHPPIGGDNRGKVAVLDLSGQLTTLSPEYASLAGLVWDLAGDEVFYTGSITGSRRALFAASAGGKVRTVANVPASLTIQDMSTTGEILLATESVKNGIRGRGPSDAEERELTWLDWPLLRDISTDGSLILFDEQGDGGGPAYKVFVRKTDGTPAVQIGEGYGMRLSWSARWALTRPVDSVSRYVIQPIGPGEPRTLDFGGRSRVVWFPDDRRLLVSTVQPSGALQVFVHDLETGQKEPLTPEGFTGLQVTPDGQSAFVTNSQGELMTWPVAGGEPQPVPWFQSSDVMVGLTRDGRAIFVATTRPEDQLPRKVYQVERSTGERRLWQTFGSADPSGGRQIGVPLVSADGQAYAYRYGERFSDLFVVDGLR
jgi:Tol biopolymer transport system component